MQKLQSDVRCDLFVSHASEDKDVLVRPLAYRLIERGLSVWYDEFVLRPGDSLSESIDIGLAKAKFGVIILSKDFMLKPWTKRELRGLTANEIDGRSRIIPIWHGVTKDDILNFSPPLADLVALNSSLGVDRIADEIAVVAGPEEMRSSGGGLFFGSHSVGLNGNLLSLPWQFLPADGSFAKNRYVLLPSPSDKGVVLCFPKGLYVELLKNMSNAITVEPRIRERWERFLIGASRETGVTTKGELVLPTEIVDYLRFEKSGEQVVFVGSGRKFEIVSFSDWTKFVGDAPPEEIMSLQL